MVLSDDRVTLELVARVSYQTAASAMKPTPLERTENMALNPEADHLGANLGLLACVLGCVCFWAALAYALVAVLS